MKTIASIICAALFLVTGCDSLFTFGSRAHKDMSQPDTTAPVFSGLTTAYALPNNEAFLIWIQASDERNKQSEMKYDIYMSQIPGAYDYNIPTVTVTGVGSHKFTGLSGGEAYFFVVKSRDKFGNRDGNTIEKKVVNSIAHNPTYDNAYYDQAYYTE